MKNFFKKSNIKNNKGVAILFAMAVVSIILAIALSISRIAFKEASLTISARQANDAFYAADTGAECALYLDKNNSFLTDNADLKLCASLLTYSLSSPPNPPIGNSIGTFFQIFPPNLGANLLDCASVNIRKDTVGEDSIVTTTINSKGYNGNAVTCGPNTNSAERELEISY